MSNYSSLPSQGLGGAGAAFLGCYFLVLLIIVVLIIWLFWRILEKAGYSPWLSLLNLIPFGQFVLLFILALGNWPALRRVAPTYIPPGGYGAPPAPGYQPPAPSYQPPGPPMNAPAAPPAPPAPPTYQPPAPPPAPPAQ